jgi:RpiR family carbohydrate utilization transcriptional regulator
MLSQIARAVPDLSRAEKRVASWVLDHPKQATSATLAHIANECGTSEPTVLRFCRRMGMKGFRELGVRVAESLSVPGSYVHRDVNPDDSISDAAIKVMDASIQSLAEMRAQLSSMAFAGLGASGHVARDACHKFFRLGIPCSSLLDTPMILQFAAIAEPDDVLVLLSHTGRWQEFAQAADIARERGTLFPCRVIEDTNVFTPMSSRLGQLALLDALLVALALTHGSAATERLRLSKDALQPRDRSLES